jgi:hypothetical protein
MKSRVFLVVLLIAGVFSIVIAFRIGPFGKWIESAGLIFDIAGIVQLDIAGVFERILGKYEDQEKYPYGPPSYIVREVSDDPGRPVRTRIRNTLFFNTRTGFGLIVFGFFGQFVGNWAP